MHSNMSFLPSEIIKKKRDGFALSEAELNFFIMGYTKGEIPEYQMSALLMAIYFKNMTEPETLSLTKCMLNSGVVVSFNSNSLKVDKHSTGGVGDKTSLILGPIVAAVGIPVPMISGRGLGHTGGTLDKLESIPGFNTQLSLEQFKKNVEDSKICFIGQTKEICPADKKIYALRDVTATVESLPLICASIMSKKLAEGIDGLVLDVKFGTGAFMKTAETAEQLARALISIAKGYGKSVVALLTNMNEPLGRFAGNSLEIHECLEIMRGQSFIHPQTGRDLYEDTRELSLKLSAHMIVLGGKADSFEKGYELAKTVLNSGKALAVFENLCRLQSGQLKQLPSPKHSLKIFASESGYISGFNTEKIGIAGIKIKAGRAKTQDLISPTAGIEFHLKMGDPVTQGDLVFTLWGDDPSLFSAASHELQESVMISFTKPQKQDLIIKTLLN